MTDRKDGLRSVKTRPAKDGASGSISNDVGSGTLRLSGLRKEFAGGTMAVDGVDLAIDPGELIVFLGPSGCGKTTTLRLIAGLEEPTDGRITFDARDITNQPPEDRNVSMVFQDLALYPHLTARENIAFPLRAARRRREYSKSTIADRVNERSAMLGISDLLDRKVVNLSGGQRQRVALARAIVRDPQIFLMDEAFGSLDAALRREFWTEFKKFQRKIGITMIHVTHDQEEAMVMADRIAVFRDGRIVQLGTPTDIFQMPRFLFCAKFVGAPKVNLLTLRRVKRDREMVFGGYGMEIALESEELDSSIEEVMLAVRPQRLLWGNAGADECELPARVTVIESVGTERVAYCVCEEGDHPEVRCTLSDSDQVEEGDAGYVRFKKRHAMLFAGTEDDAPAWPVLRMSSARDDGGLNG